MRDDRISDCCLSCSDAGSASEDAQAQAAVLVLVLTEQPAVFTRAELALELLGPEPEFKQADQHQRAVRDLVRAGLLYQQGQLILPTRAMRIVDSLELQ
jgi:hypothetical protein